MSTDPDLTGGLIGLLGQRVVQASAQRVVLTYAAVPALHQPFGLVHGGAHAAAVETAASIGAQLAAGEGVQVVGLSNHTDFLRPVRDGLLTAEAVPVHVGRSQQLWQVEVRREDGALVARGQVRLTNLPPAP